MFARRQLRVSEPFLRLQCFRDKTFAVSTLIVICAHMMFMAPSIMVPLFVQDIQGLSARCRAWPASARRHHDGRDEPHHRALLDRRGPRPLIVAGCVTVLAQVRWMTRKGPEGERGDELAAAQGHHDTHLGALVAQPADQFGALVGGDAAADAKERCVYDRAAA